MLYGLISAHSYIENSNLNLCPVFAIDETIFGQDLEIIQTAFPSSQIIKVNSNSIRKDFPSFSDYSPSNISAMYRIYAIEKIPNNLTLYVDVDTVCKSSLTGLSEYVDSLLIEDKYVAACSHYRPSSEHRICGIDSPYLYFNSGVLLFYPESISKFISPMSISNLVVSRPELLALADQSPLNFLLKGKVRWMHYKYNTITWHFMPNNFWYEPQNNFLVELLDLSISRALSESAIIHFSAIKPWLLLSSASHENDPKTLEYWIKARKDFFAVHKFLRDSNQDIE